MKRPEPLIWIPDDFDEQVVVKARVLEAQYFPSEGYIGLKLKLDDGSTRATDLHKSSFTFRGRPWKEVPQEECDREMEKTARLFAKARGRSISLRMYKHQIRLEE